MNPKERFTNNDCRKYIPQSEYFFAPTEIATRGVTAKETPMPIIKINMVKLLPNEAAAKGAEPKVPTIKLSTTPIIIKPSCPIITGYAN